jgi:hypothetical protein
LLLALLVVLLATASYFGQSTNQDFPTPVTSNEIAGTIKPRDIGDARLTAYYYQFDADQGDLFLNLVTKNFTGDIDVFTQNALRPLTKIVVYADFAESETGRVLYFRKPEKLILRIQGRPPGDDAATFRIKFAGSFVASTQADPGTEPSLPSLTAKNDSGIRVNSVGTIVEVIPKATPAPPRTETAKAEDERDEKPVTTDEPVTPPTVETAEAPEKKVEVVVTENIEAPKETKTPPARTRRTGRRTAPPKTTKTSPDAPVTGRTVESPAAVPTVGRRRRPPAKPPVTTADTAAKAPNPLEKINLVIEFKDGNVIQRPMSDVLRFTVDKGVLTVISKDGSIGRYSILDVAKLTVQ